MHENRASRVSKLRCGWSCQAILVTSVTLYSPCLERICCMKSQRSFSRLTRPQGVWGERASHSRTMLTALRAFQKHPKTTVLQSKITTKTLLNSFSGHHKENKSRDIFCVLMFQHLLANTHYRLCDLKSQPRLGQVKVCIWLPTKLKMQDLLDLTMRLTVFSPL